MGVEYLENNVPSGDENVPVILRKCAKRSPGPKRSSSEWWISLLDRQLDWQTVNLNPVIDGAALLLRHQFTRKSVRLKKIYDRTIPAIRGDKTRIEQVMVNLFINSLQAMKKGGRLTVTTSSRRLGEQERRNFGTRTANPFRAGDRWWWSKSRTPARASPPRSAQHFRPIFHHQADRRGHRPRPQRDPQDRRVARGPHRPDQRAGGRDQSHIDLQGTGIDAQDFRGTLASRRTSSPTCHEKDPHRRRRSRVHPPAQTQPGKVRPLHRARGQ